MPVAGPQVHGAGGRRCGRQATQNCTLPADVADPPAWTNMRPGQCVLQYLREAQRGFSNSPRLNGIRNRTGPDLNYWTGAQNRPPRGSAPGLCVARPAEVKVACRCLCACFACRCLRACFASRGISGVHLTSGRVQSNCMDSCLGSFSSSAHCA